MSTKATVKQVALQYSVYLMKVSKYNNEYLYIILCFLEVLATARFRLLVADTNPHCYAGLFAGNGSARALQMH